MVFGTLLACVVLTGLAQSGKEKSETLLRWHFAGTKQIANLKDLQTFREVVAFPETEALREAAAKHLATRAAARFTKGGDNANAEIMRLIQPLLPDLWREESSFQMTAKGADATDWILALKLDANRTAEWNRTLTQLAKAAGMQGGAGGASWTAQKDNYRLTFSTNKDWMVIEGGVSNPDAKIAKDFRSDLEKRRGKVLLTAEANGPLLAKVLNSERLAHAPKIQVRGEPKDDGIRTEAVLEYPEDLGFQVEKWNVPTDLIREPLIGFTAVQGVEKKLASAEKLQKLGAGDMPNQLFSWAQSSSPFSISMAAEVKNPAQVVTNVAQALQQIKMPMLLFRSATNQTAIIMEGLGFKPKLEVAPEPYNSFLLARAFPSGNAAINKPAPPELFKQLNKKNVVYYDWEITGPRAKQLDKFWQLYHLITQMRPTRADSPSMKWISAIATKLGNTVTEGTLENRRQIKVVRQSQLGFNSTELLLLAHLVDDSDVVQPPTGQPPTGQNPSTPPPPSKPQ